jgi:hypothetical protein
MTKVIDVINAVVATLQGIQQLSGKVVFAYDEQDFTNRIVGLKNFPGAGVVYEGIHSIGDPGPSARVGISGEMVFSIVLIDHGPNIRMTDQNKHVALNLLQSIRETIVATKSPTGHYYRFLVEAPALLKDGAVYWVSRWSTPFQTRPGNTPS